MDSEQKRIALGYCPHDLLNTLAMGGKELVVYTCCVRQMVKQPCLGLIFVGTIG